MRASISKPPVLVYSVDRAPEIEEHPDGGVTVTIPTDRSLQRFVAGIAKSGLLASMLTPLAAIIFWVFSTRRPRAILEITPEHFSVTEAEDNALGIGGERRSWPLSELGELRPNRFDGSLYVTIVGKDSFDLLGDIPDPAVAAVAAALNDARKRIADGRSQSARESS